MGYFARITKRVSPRPAGAADGTRRINAVLMGRKTWDSIPPKHRPLKDRLNVVITRDTAAFSQSLGRESPSANAVEQPIVASGVLDALSQLETREDVDRVFVIGGASIYATALELPQTKRVLLTKIAQEYECDTYFPVNLEESEVWKRVGGKEMGEWIGEEVAEQVEEKGVRFEFYMFERE